MGRPVLGPPHIPLTRERESAVYFRVEIRHIEGMTYVRWLTAAELLDLREELASQVSGGYTTIKADQVSTFVYLAHTNGLCAKEIGIESVI